MNRLDWTIAILRVLAISLLVGITAQLPSLLSTALLLSPNQPHPFNSLGYLEMAFLSLLTSLLIAMVVWRQAPAIASRIWRDRPPETLSAQGPLTGSDLQDALLMLLGVWLLVNSLTDFTGMMFSLSANYSLSLPFAQRSGQLLAVLVELGAGLILTLGHRTVGGLIRRLRTAGLRPAA